MILPKYFYDINAILPNGKKRWHDTCSSISSGSILLNPRTADPGFLAYKFKRNKSYDVWLSSFIINRGGVPGRLITEKQMKFQAIRVISGKHSESTKQDWWEPYQDACFRVFLQPETFYEPQTGTHKQWYVLSPEDCYLVNQYEIEKLGIKTPPRNYDGQEHFISKHPALRQIRLIPVECCAHMRHETTAGELPIGL